RNDSTAPTTYSCSRSSWTAPTSNSSPARARAKAMSGARLMTSGSESEFAWARSLSSYPSGGWSIQCTRVPGCSASKSAMTCSKNGVKVSFFRDQVWKTISPPTSPSAASSTMSADGLPVGRSPQPARASAVSPPPPATSAVRRVALMCRSSWERRCRAARRGRPGSGWKGQAVPQDAAVVPGAEGSEGRADRRDLEGLEGEGEAVALDGCCAVPERGSLRQRALEQVDHRQRAGAGHLEGGLRAAALRLVQAHDHVARAVLGELERLDAGARPLGEGGQGRELLAALEGAGGLVQALAHVDRLGHAGIRPDRIAQRVLSLLRERVGELGRAQHGRTDHGGGAAVVLAQHAAHVVPVGGVVGQRDAVVRLRDPHPAVGAGLEPSEVLVGVHG